MVAISGSLRVTSYTNMALEVALAGAKQAGAQASLLNLRDFDLQFAGLADTEDGASSGLVRLSQIVQGAHGILLGTPEYHGSLSGVLKNALDLMGFDEFEGKMIGLVGVSAGRMGAFDALNTLRNVGRALHAWVVPEQVSIPEVSRVFSNNGELLDRAIGERLLHLGTRVAEFAKLHECGRDHEFVASWEAAMENPGG